MTDGATDHREEALREIATNIHPAQIPTCSDVFTTALNPTGCVADLQSKTVVAAFHNLHKHDTLEVKPVKVLAQCWLG